MGTCSGVQLDTEISICAIMRHVIATAAFWSRFETNTAAIAMDLGLPPWFGEVQRKKRAR